jgi:hypothetical protein
MARGRDMAAAAAVKVPSSAEYVPDFVGTITEPEPQSQTVWSPGSCRSLRAAPVDRPYPKSSVQQVFRL